MAAASGRLTEDQFRCSTCLDVFTDPVVIPCGHNFCKNCITKHWDVKIPCHCPVCKNVFYARPELRVNTLISNMAAQFRPISNSSLEKRCAKTGNISCDICTGTKLKALKSCLVCQTSYCETHLEPHLTVLGLKRHQLIDSVENLEDDMCLKHNKPLELFCKVDEMCVCRLCIVLDHKTHDVVPLKAEYEAKKAELGKTEGKIQQMIQKRQLKIQEIKCSVQLSKQNADIEIAEGVQVFTNLIECVEESQADLIEIINNEHKTIENQAEGFIKDLEQEISELIKRCAKLEQLSHSEDHLHLVQGFPSLNEGPPTKDWTEVCVCTPTYEGTVLRAVVPLEKVLNKEITKVFEVELKRVQHYAVDVTLDPDTTHPKLIISDDVKQVYHGELINFSDNPNRFHPCVNVLGQQILSSGIIYYEVQVKGKTDWDLGVVRGSINGRGKIRLHPQHGYWTICLRNENEYKACTDSLVCLTIHSKLFIVKYNYN